MPTCALTRSALTAGASLQRAMMGGMCITSRTPAKRRESATEWRRIKRMMSHDLQSLSERAQRDQDFDRAMRHFRWACVAFVLTLLFNLAVLAYRFWR